MILINKDKILNEVRIFFDKGQFVEAFNYLKNKKFYFFLNNKSSFYKSEFLFLYGAILASLGNYKKALLYLKKALTSTKQDKSEIYYYIIISFLNLENHQQVKYYFTKILERTFSPFYIIFSYYKCLKKKIDLNISIESIKDFLLENEENIFDTFTNVILLILEKKFDFAYELITDEEFNDYQDLYIYHLIYLIIIYNLKKYDKVVDYYRQNCNFLVSIEALNIYSISLIKLELHDEALKILDNMLFFKSNLVIPLVNKAKIYYLKKNYYLATKILRYALRSKSIYKDKIYFLLSNISYHLGLLNDVIRFTNKIETGTEIQYKALFNLALIYYDLNRYNDAKKTYDLIDEKIFKNSKYIKWNEKIFSIKENYQKIDTIKFIIKLVPFFFVIISLIVFIILYFFVKK